MATKRERKKQMVLEMISLYCRQRHHSKDRQLCPQCQELADYALERSDKCPFFESRSFCSSCPVHCYAPEMRERIRTVMRYSGPRMLFYHPIAAVHHFLSSRFA